jgi:hypothetical protein
MYVKRKKNRSGTTSVVVAEKTPTKYIEHITIGISSDTADIETYIRQGKEWIINYRKKNQPEFDFEQERTKALQEGKEQTESFISNIKNILINGHQLILNRVFDKIGFNQIQDDVFRQLVLSRLSYPSSKTSTSEYLKNHFDDDVTLTKIYRYLDKLNHTQKELIQDISVAHTRHILGGQTGALFYDVTTLYFETDKEDDLRKTGFSKEGRHSNPQIILGLLLSIDGYPLSYSIHEGNKYEGHTMLPVVEEFVTKHNLDDFVVIADSGLMNDNNIAELERLGYKYSYTNG